MLKFKYGDWETTQIKYEAEGITCYDQMRKYLMRYYYNYKEWSYKKKFIIDQINQFFYL